MISLYPPGVMPVRKELENGLEVNTDGAGFAIVVPEEWGDQNDSQMLMAKDHENPGYTLDMFMNLREKYPEGPAVFHSRLSTGSAVSFANTHPVAVGGDPETLLFHNGDLSTMISVAEGESDTVRLADDWLPHLDLDDWTHADSIEWVMTRTGSKAVILTSNPRWQEQAYVYNRGQWLLTPGGALHSNPDYLGKGVGWDEMTLIQPPEGAGDGEAGDLWRYNLPQPGQCGRCNLFGHDEMTCERPRAKVPFRWRNESQRRRKVGTR